MDDEIENLKYKTEYIENLKSEGFRGWLGFILFGLGLLMIWILWIIDKGNFGRSKTDIGHLLFATGLLGLFVYDGLRKIIKSKRELKEIK